MPSCRLARLLVACCLLTSQVAVGQSAIPQPTQRDPQALQILAQALATAGGAQALSAIRDYEGTGNITYYWSGEEVKGTVILKGRGIGEFRVDASLPEGVRTWALSGDEAFLRETDGTVKRLPSYSAANAGSVTAPLISVLRAFTDSSMGISYVGLEMEDGVQLHHIRIWQVFGSNSDPNGLSSHLSVRDLFVDASTYLVTQTIVMGHPQDHANLDFPCEFKFSDFHVENGVLIPFSVVASVSGQRTSLTQLTAVRFNVGLQDSDFQQ